MYWTVNIIVYPVQLDYKQTPMCTVQATMWYSVSSDMDITQTLTVNIVRQTWHGSNGGYGVVKRKGRNTLQM